MIKIFPFIQEFLISARIYAYIVLIDKTVLSFLFLKIPLCMQSLEKQQLCLKMSVNLFLKYEPFSSE